MYLKAIFMTCLMQFSEFQISSWFKRYKQKPKKMRLQNMVITAIPRQISIPNSNTINLRTCSNIVFQHFFRKSNITRDISVQRASWSGRVGPGWAGSPRKWIQWVKTRIFCYMNYISNMLRFRNIQLFCFPIYRYRSSLAFAKRVFARN